MLKVLTAFVVSCVVYGVAAIVLYFVSRVLSPWGRESRKEALLDVALWWVVMVLISTAVYSLA